MKKLTKPQKARKGKPLHLVIERHEERGVIARPVLEGSDNEVDEILEEVTNRGVTLEGFGKVHLKPRCVQEMEDQENELDDGEEDCEEEKADDDE